MVVSPATAPHAPRHRHIKLRQRLPPQRTAYPLWPKPLRQPPHVKVINEDEIVRRPPSQARPHTAYEEVEGGEQEDDVIRCSFGLVCRTGYSDQTSKNGVATIKDYTDAKFDPKGLGYYCDGCFKLRHPWYRLPTTWVYLKDYHNADEEFQLHETTIKHERIVQDFGSLLKITEQFRRDAKAMNDSMHTDSKLKKAMKDMDDVEDMVREIMEDVRSGGSSGMGTRKERVAASKLQNLWRMRAARKKMRHMIREIYERFEDPATGKSYYFNKKTGETVWFKPHALGSEELDIDPDVEREKERKRRWREKHPMTEEEAALSIQGLWRTRVARQRLHDMIASAYQKVLDPNTGRYYFVNKRTGAVSWTHPKGVSDDELLTPRHFEEREKAKHKKPKKVRDHPMTEEEAALSIQGLWRTRVARQRLHDMLLSAYQKVLDPNTGRYYFVNKRTGTVSWTHPGGVKDDELLTPRSFQHRANLRKIEEAKQARGGKPMTDEEAAVHIQGLWRTRAARREMHKKVQKSYRRVTSPEGISYYYNVETGQTSWTRPKNLGDEELQDFDPSKDKMMTPAEAAAKAAVREHKARARQLRKKHMTEEEAAVLVQSAWRCREARRSFRGMLLTRFERVLDDSQDPPTTYYYDTVTGESLWDKPRALGNADALTPRSKEAFEGTRAEEQRQASAYHQEQERLRYKAEQRRLRGPMTEEEAAVHIQGLWRTRAARRNMVHMLSQVYEKAYDPDVGACYYYNKKTGESVWEKPKLFGAENLIETPRSQQLEREKKAEVEAQVREQQQKEAQREVEEARKKEARLQKLREEPMTELEAAQHIQGMWRTRQSRRMVRAMVHEVFEKVYDPATGKCYYYNKRTGESQWTKPALLTVDDLDIM